MHMHELIRLNMQGFIIFTKNKGRNSSHTGRYELTTCL